MTTITAPLTTITLQGLVPDVVRSCIVQQPSPPPDPGETPPPPVTAEGIYTPVAPGVTYGSLPTVSIVDTSPDQMIGCIIDTADNPQGRLNALFPSAIDGDGVIERSTNDIWVFDGATWNNVGPTPGPTIVSAQVVPPWNEIVVYDARVRTRLEVNGLAYALELLTEPAAYGVSIGLNARKVLLVETPSTDLSMTAEAPAVQIVDESIYGVYPVLYTGNDDVQSISGLPWSPGIVWIKQLDAVRNHILFDSVRGATKYWFPSASNAEITNASSLTSFDANGFSLDFRNEVNAFDGQYVAWSFEPVGPQTESTAGTITSQTYRSTFYSIFTYSGNDLSGQSVGHGFDVEPSLVILKSLTGVAGNGYVSSPLITDTNHLLLGTTAGTATGLYDGIDVTTVSVSSDVLVNGSGCTYIGYAFKDTPGLCKVGTYTGDGNATGSVVTVGFTIRFLIIKRTDSTGAWVVIDSLRNDGDNQLNISASAETTVSSFYTLSGNTFTPGRGDETVNHDLNVNGATYLYVAFGSFIPKALVPAADIELAALAPTV